MNEAEPTKALRCSKCEELKLASEFYTSKTGADGLRSECKDCFKAQVKAKRSPSKYAAERAVLTEYQGGLCACCGEALPAKGVALLKGGWSGMHKAISCRSCNTMLNLTRRDASRHKKAAAFIEWLGEE